MDLAARLAATLRRTETEAVCFGGRWWSWAELRAVAEALEAALGPAPTGAPVALLPRNRPAHLAVLFGLLAAGRSVALVNPMQGAARIAEQLAQIAPVAVVVDAEEAALPGLEGATLAVLDGARVELAARRAVAAEPAPQTLSLLTSGTTGPSKRITLPAAAVLDAAEDCALVEAEGGGALPLFVSAYPLTNIGGVYYAMPSGVTGRPIVLLEKFAVADWAAAVERHRPGLLWLPPAAVRMVLDAGVPPAALASARALRFGSAPLEAEALARFEATYGIPVLAQYGATEFAGTITALTLADHHRFAGAKRGSVGRARPGIALRVVDPATGAALGPDAVGRLEVLVPRVAPGWLPTSDLARLDADGFLFLASRADEAINRGGFKVLPEEVAAVLRRHPGVADAVVVGLPDARLGEVPVAAVEPKPGAAPEPAEILGFARSHLVAYQVPARLLVLSALPRTVSMKADRPAVRRLFEV
jgi:acyl-CoA synthetase (AMP-forming)/AMP-acid ligase II